MFSKGIPNNLNIKVILIISLILLSTHTQDSQLGSLTTMDVKLNSGTNVQIKAQKTLLMNVKIDRKVNEKQSMFISAESPYNDPFEQPRISVRSDKLFSAQCYDQSNDFMGICEIQSNQLTEGRNFTIQLSCEVDCKLFVSVYLSSQYNLQVGASVSMQNMQPTAIAKNILLQIPADAKFTQMMILATPANIEQNMESTLILANYGSSPNNPTSQKYMQKAQSTSAHRLGLFLSDKELKAGDKVALFILLAPNSEIELRSTLINENTYKLFLGQPIYDFVAGQKQKIYVIDVSQYQNTTQKFNETIRIKFMSYSGYPQIKVSFDKQFSDGKTIADWYGDQSYMYDITPKIRQQKGFNKTLYIKVKGDWSSNYYIGAFVDKKPFIALQPQIVELIHIQGGSYKNLIFVDTDAVPSDGMVQYKITVKLLQNGLQFSIRQCNEVKLLNCLINNVQDLKKPEIIQEFSKIKYYQESSQDTYIMKFNYNVKENCQVDQKKYTCKFNIILNSLPNNTNQTLAGVEMMKDTITDWLSEGVVQKGTVMKGQINYYAFDLPSSSNISALEFFATVIQGDVSLIVSQTIIYPTLRDLTNEKNDVLFSIFNNIVIRQPQIKAGYYYIGVYGYELTDYTIGVAIQRTKGQKDNKNQSDPSGTTQIRLQKSRTQTYTMPINKKVSKFTFAPVTDGQMSLVKINEVQGSISFIVMDKQEKTKTICDSKQMRQNGDSQCQFKSSINHDYVIIVSGSPEDTQVFTILYTVRKVCNMYLWNFPLNIQLNKNEGTCYFFYMNQLQDIHISIQMSSLQLMTSKLNISLQYNGQIVPITEHDKIIPKSQLQILCKNKTNYKFDSSACQFNIYIRNPDDEKTSNVEFTLAVENFVGDNVLFDRIVSKVNTDQISKQVPRKFFYYVRPGSNNDSDLCIFLTSKTNSQYRIVSKVVPNSQFLKDFDQSIYPKFNDSGANIKHVDSYMFAPVTILNIDKQSLSTSQQKASVVLISVFGYPSKFNQFQKQFYAFQIEASRGGSQLRLGDSKIGYVEKDNIYEYQILLNQNQSSSVEIREFDEKKCVKAMVFNIQNDQQGTPFDYVYTFSNKKGSRLILVQTTQDFCTFQISYNSLSVPVINILSSIPYEVELQKNAIKYYSYYHNNNQSFIVLQMVSAGNAYLYVQSVKNNYKMTDVLQIDVNSFQYVSDMNGDLQISKNSEGFCANCYYLIAVQAKGSVNAQITVNPFDIPIYLRQSALLRDRLYQNGENMYQLYSRVNFNVSITLLYGKVTVSIRDYNNTQIKTKALTLPNNQVIELKVPPTNNSQFDFFMSNSRYIVIVKAQQPASYYIQVKKAQAGIQAYQGVPLTIDLKPLNSITITFQNLQEGGTLNVLIEDTKSIQDDKENTLQFSFSMENRKNLLKKKNKIESSYNIQLQAVRGVYTFNIVSNMTTTVIVIFAKRQFTHLQAGRTYILDSLSIFEIFSPGQSIMIEIFVCLGDVDVTASSNYTMLKNDNISDQGIVRLQHSNFGNHYVITAENIKGEYFVQAKPQNKYSTYLITYHLFDSLVQRMPYRVYTVKNTQISYKYTLEGVQFSLYRVMKKDGSQMQKLNVSYKFYISTSNNQIETMTKCSIGNAYTTVQVKDASEHGWVKFVFTTQQIKKITNNSQSYLVGAQATLQFSNRPISRVSEINFVYDIIQLTINNQVQFTKEPVKQSSIKTIILWVVLPFLIGSIFLFFAARFLLRSFSAYPTQLVEQQEGGVGVSNDVLKNQKQLKMDVK